MRTLGKTDHMLAAQRMRKGFGLTALLIVGLLSAAAIGYGAWLLQGSARQRQVAKRTAMISRDSVWLHDASSALPRSKWKPVLTRLEANWGQVAKVDPASAKTLIASYRVFDKAINANGRVGAAAADKLSESGLAQSALIGWDSEQKFKQAEYLAGGGAASLLVCLFVALGLMRRQRLLQFQTTQSYLAAERAGWDKQRRAYDSQRDQLIAELQQAQQHKVELDSLRQSGSRQFEEFFRTLPVACFCIAASGKIVRWNAACESLYGFTSSQALEQTLWETIVPDTERQHVEAQFQQALAGNSLADIEREDRRANGTTLRVHCSLAPLRDAAGQIIGCVSANLAVADTSQYEQQIEAQRTHLKELQDKLDRQQAEIAEASAQIPAPVPEMPMHTPALHLSQCADSAPANRESLAGLCSHTEFQEELAALADAASRTNEPLTIMLVDVDHFSEYNQALGYRSGDEALTSIAEMLHKKVRSIDTVARYGADEFAVLLPNTNRTGAEIAAERFQAGIKGIPWKRKKLTASLAVSVLTTDFQSSQTVIDRARKLLQDTKVSGPGRILIADEPEPAKPIPAARSRRKAA